MTRPTMLRVQASGFLAKDVLAVTKVVRPPLATNGSIRKCTTFGTDITVLAYRKAGSEVIQGQGPSSAILKITTSCN